MVFYFFPHLLSDICLLTGITFQIKFFCFPNLGKKHRILLIYIYILYLSAFGLPFLAPSPLDRVECSETKPVWCTDVSSWVLCLGNAQQVTQSWDYPICSDKRKADHGFFFFSLNTFSNPKTTSVKQIYKTLWEVC